MGNISYSPHYPQTCSGDEADIEFIILLLYFLGAENTDICHYA